MDFGASAGLNHAMEDRNAFIFGPLLASIAAIVVCAAFSFDPDVTRASAGVQALATFAGAGVALLAASLTLQPMRHQLVAMHDQLVAMREQTDLLAEQLMYVRLERSESSFAAHDLAIENLDRITITLDKLLEKYAAEWRADASGQVVERQIAVVERGYAQILQLPVALTSKPGLADPIATLKRNIDGARVSLNRSNSAILRASDVYGPPAHWRHQIGPKNAQDLRRHCDKARKALEVVRTEADETRARRRVEIARLEEDLEEMRRKRQAAALGTRPAAETVRQG